MVCPYCSHQTKVINSRHQKRNNQTWRRRQCVSCQAIFTTHEQIELTSTLSVREADDSLMPFVKERLFSSLLLACDGLNDPYGTATELTATVINELRGKAGDAMVSSKDIAATTGQILRRFNAKAFLKYVSQHDRWFDVDATLHAEPKQS